MTETERAELVRLRRENAQLRMEKEVVGGQDQDAGGRHLPDDGPGGSDAINAGHPHVH